MEEKKELQEAEDTQVAGGSSQRGTGYCPYTEDRSCRVPSQGTFKPWGEGKESFCEECGWRAW